MNLQRQQFRLHSAGQVSGSAPAAGIRAMAALQPILPRLRSRPFRAQASAVAVKPLNPWPAVKPEPVHVRRNRMADESPFTIAPMRNCARSTIAPKNVSGFKLPSSTLLSAGEAPQSVREDELREEAKVLVEKCAEFDVRGQVVQINPGPMVTTFEFKPEAGVKYSRVTGLADDLCLAMRAESILIERMAGKSTVGIQVPNHERETIHLRDVIESETFIKAVRASRSRWAKTSTAASSSPIWPPCRIF